MSFEKQIREGMSLWTRVEPTGARWYRITLPFWNDIGDPVTLGLRAGEDGKWEMLNDGGAVAGTLLSNDQDESGRAGMKLAKSLTEGHRIRINWSEGTLELDNDGHETLHDAVTQLGRVVITLITATPHLPRRRDR